MKRLFLMVLIFSILVLPSVWAALSYTAGPDSATPHYVKCSGCQQNFWRCTEATSHELQASCSTDSNCISTNFYLCQHTAHTYAKLAACGHAVPGHGKINMS